MTTATELLPRLVGSIEALEAENAVIRAQIKDVYEEAKSLGFDAKVLRQIVAERRKSPADLAEHEALLETYRNALADAACPG